MYNSEACVQSISKVRQWEMLKYMANRFVIIVCSLRIVADNKLLELLLKGHEFHRMYTTLIVTPAVLLSFKGLI
jgi:hypothetical protein